MSTILIICDEENTADVWALKEFMEDNFSNFPVPPDVIRATYEEALIILPVSEVDLIIFCLDYSPFSEIPRRLRYLKIISETYRDRPLLLHSFQIVPFDPLGASYSDVEELLSTLNIQVTGFLIRDLMDLNIVYEQILDVLQLDKELSEYRSARADKMPKVFISYAREDYNQAKAIYRILESNGCRPWIDAECLLPGQVWEQEIEKAIAASHFFIACLSKNSVGKEGHVQAELKLGLKYLSRQPENSIFLIPLRLDDCSVPYRLKDLNYLDFSHKGAARKLLSAIDEGVKKRIANLKQRKGLAN